MFSNLNRAIEVIGLYKKYGNVRALNGLTFHVNPGEIYGLIGPNGAGKTTALKILVGLLKPDRETAYIYGHDVVSDRVNALKLVGYIPENPVAFQNLTITEFIQFIATLRNLRINDIEDDINYYLDIFNLIDKRNKLISELSRGMLQKVLAISAFIVRPKVLIMDEPMAGMDPESQYVFKEEVRKLIRNGVSAIISSHILSSVEKFCDRIGIIYNGRILVEGTIDKIKGIVSERKDATLEEVFLKIIKIEEER